MADKDPTRSAASGTDADPQLDLKKRARRRLVGAVALALLAVIVLPMVMDQEPKPVTQDIQIRIPSQEPGANSVVSRITPKQFAPTPLPAENKPAPPPAAAATVAAATAAAAATATVAAAPETKPETKPAAKPEAKSETKPPAKAEAKPEAKKAESKPEPKAEAKTAAKAEAAHKPEAKAPAKSAEKTAEKPAEKPGTKAGESARAAALLNDEHWLIQLGAYQDQANVKTLQGKVKELGYNTFTEKVDTPSGPRIRVRCGPFPSREAAEKAQARLKKIGAGGPSGGSVAQAK